MYCHHWLIAVSCADPQEKFAKGIVAAWDKVMNLDRFDLAGAA